MMHETADRQHGKDAGSTSSVGRWDERLKECHDFKAVAANASQNTENGAMHAI